MLFSIQDDLSKTLDKNKIAGASEQTFRRFHPHITIAFRDLTERHFNLLWGEVEHKSFSGRFSTESITLLRHNGKIWTVEDDFLFGQEKFDAPT
tara:strand:- start:996 stop:1277 length:282 start_codon:yes stop_codon:yes gene_type:complete